MVFLLCTHVTECCNFLSYVSIFLSYLSNISSQQCSIFFIVLQNFLIWNGNNCTCIILALSQNTIEWKDKQSTHLTLMRLSANYPESIFSLDSQIYLIRFGLD